MRGHDLPLGLLSSILGALQVLESTLLNLRPVSFDWAGREWGGRSWSAGLTILRLLPLPAIDFLLSLTLC